MLQGRGLPRQASPDAGERGRDVRGLAPARGFESFHSLVLGAEKVHERSRDFLDLQSAGGSPPPPGTTGLYHVAIRYPDRRTLADAVRRVADAGLSIDGASDHGVSEAIYLRDPDGNGVELYRDRPEAEAHSNTAYRRQDRGDRRRRLRPRR